MQWLVVACAVLSLAQGSFAQQGPEATMAPALAPCELHVWPGSPLGSVYQGWLHGGIVNGAVTGRDGYPKVPANPLDTATQATLLDQSKPQAALGRSADRLALHAEALDSRTIRSTPGRLAPGTTGCYAELVVDDVILKQDSFSGSYLSVLYRFRDFGTDAQPRRIFSTWVKTPLKKLGVQGPMNVDEATQELHAAYREDLKLFAAALNKPVSSKRH